MIQPTDKVALFMERAFTERTGKMGLGVLRYSQHDVACVIDSENKGGDLSTLTGMQRHLPIVGTVDDAVAFGATVMILGIAPPGGLVPPDWWPALDRAVELGISLVNGLHDKLGPRYPELRQGQFVWDVRTEPPGIGVGTAAARMIDNRRVLMVGTDMSVGKMTAGLELAKAARQAGVETGFVATGQVGIVITGAGVPLDAVRLDFASGAIEAEVMRQSDKALIVVEGQGSLIHPGSSANLPLMRGSCPTHLVLCHRAGMAELPRVPWVKVPPLKQIIELNEALVGACDVFPAAKTVAIALNTGHLDATEAESAIRQIEEETGLTTTDPVRHGGEKLFRAVVS